MEQTLTTLAQSPWAFAILALLTVVSAAQPLYRICSFFTQFIRRLFIDGRTSIREWYINEVTDEAKSVYKNQNISLKIAEILARVIKDIITLILSMGLTTVLAIMVIFVFVDIQIGNNVFSNTDVLMGLVLFFINLTAVVLKAAVAYLMISFDRDVWRELQRISADETLPRPLA
jgi:hypothetical protein